MKTKRLGEKRNITQVQWTVEDVNTMEEARKRKKALRNSKYAL